ncbi:hypothetical protein BJY52DRAFT_1119536 [Lactarius psammicola]|nr:hypothetical protein BJY52DRAFT_1119536 [Lactarius psammicola]
MEERPALPATSKKRKLDPGRLAPREAKFSKSTSQPSRLDIVPVEILAEILYYITSPKDILSVARCNKRLCATLLNPSNVMIWRRARSHCIIPGLPPPPPGWSESAYAAFIFDGGNCHVCGISTARMFLSFVVRIRLCGKVCILPILLRRLDVPPLAGSVPWAVRPYLLLLSVSFPLAMESLPGLLTLIVDRQVFGLTWKRLRQNSTPTSGIQGSCSHIKAEISPPTGSQHAGLLFEWRQMWTRRYRATKASNMAFAQHVAEEAGWSLHDLLNNPTYQSLHRSHIRCLETLPESVVRSLMTRIDVEILSKMEKRERRQKAHAQQIRRAEIARHYDRLVERKIHPTIPILAEFRGLPIIRALQDREDTAPFSSDNARSSSAKPVEMPQVLKSELKGSQLIGGMINSDLNGWVDTALREFDAILGHPNWKRASTKLLHPSERIDARFICTLCHSTPKGHDNPESLDFRGACAHECAGRHRKAATKKQWKADQFVPDRKAIDVLSQALTLMGLKAENRETEGEVNSVGARFLCNSCDLPTVMDFWRLAGHCRRHDKMQVALVSTAEAVALMAGHQYDTGSFAFYTARTDKANKMRQTKTFGCRHCQHEIPKPTRARRTQNSGDRVEKRFTFNGLVSHAKEKCVSSLFLP